MEKRCAVVVVSRGWGEAGRKTPPPKLVPILGMCSISASLESMKTGIASLRVLAFIWLAVVGSSVSTEKLALAHVSIHVRIILATANYDN